jgi:hypothetical protein
MERPLPGVSLNWRQLGGVAGIVGVVLFVVGIVLQGDAPTISDSVEDTQAWYAENGSMYLTADFIIGLGIMLFLLPFFVVLRSALADAEGGHGHWSQVSFFGAIFFILVGGAASSFAGALAVAEGGLDEGAAEALSYLNFYGFAGLSLTLVPFFLGVAFVVMRTGVFWGWLAWTSLAFAAVSLISACSAVEADPDGILSMLSFVSFIGLGLTILLLSAGLLRGQGGASA